MTTTHSQPDASLTEQDDITGQRSSFKPGKPDMTVGDKETREIVTPYAFGVAPFLLGKPLATPVRRGVAQAIDLGCISLISSLNPIVFAIISGLTFVKAGSNIAHKENRGLGSKVLRFCGVALLALVLFSVFNDSPPRSFSSFPETPETNLQPVLVGVTALMWQRCDDDYDCLLDLTQRLAENQTEFGSDLAEITKVHDALMDGSSLTSEQQSGLRDALVAQYELSTAEKDSSAQEASDNSEFADDTETSAQNDDNFETPKATSDRNSENGGSFISNGIRQVKGLLSDMGLSLGWAALYYSVFTAWLKGYTPGKWLTGIRVVRLDGKSPTLWESFGRYGGYGAGLATGFMGFLQIFWDPNRQAIQDKIAETLVVRQTAREARKEWLQHAAAEQNEGVSGEGI